jgi:hypothetical protein
MHMMQNPRYQTPRHHQIMTYTPEYKANIQLMDYLATLGFFAPRLNTSTGGRFRGIIGFIPGAGLDVFERGGGEDASCGRDEEGLLVS